MLEHTPLFISLSESANNENIDPLKSLVKNCETLTEEKLDEGVRTLITKYYDSDTFPENPSQEQINTFKEASKDFTFIANKVYDSLRPKTRELFDYTHQGLLIYLSTQKHKPENQIKHLRNNFD